jgi:hypothetical protein
MLLSTLLAPLGCKRNGSGGEEDPTPVLDPIGDGGGADDAGDNSTDNGGDESVDGCETILPIVNGKAVCFDLAAEGTKATSSQILSGYYLWNDDGKIVNGTLKNHGAVNLSTSSVPSGPGFVDSISVGLSPADVCNTKTLFGANGTAVCGLNSPVVFSGVESATSITSNSVTLNWTDTPSIHSYMIMNVTNDPGILVKMVAAPASNSVVGGLTKNTTYKFAVRAVDSQGRQVANDAVEEITTLNTAPPEDISGLTVWLKADNADATSNSSLSDNDNLAIWKDLSPVGNDITQGTVTNQPKFIADGGNGFPVIRFDGNDNFMDGTLNASVGSNFTVFVVSYFAHLNQPNGDFDYLINMGSGGANANFSMSRAAGNHSVPQAYYSYDGVAARLGPVLTGNQWGIYTGLVDNSSPFHSFYLDGTSQAVADYASSLTINDAFSLGYYPSGNSHYLNGDIAEVIYYNGTLSNADRERIECYLATRYSLTVPHACN